MKRGVLAFHDITVPSFNEFIRRPNESFCAKIDANRLLVEMIGGAGSFMDSTFSSKMLLWGQYSLVMRYRREKDEKYRPTCALSLDFDEDRVLVTQLQGSNDKTVAYRFASSFDSVWYFALLLEEAFIKKGIPVEVEKFPEGIEWAGYNSTAISKYQQLWQLLSTKQAQFLNT